MPASNSGECQPMADKAVADNKIITPRETSGVTETLRSCLTRSPPSVIRSNFVDCRSLLIDQKDSSTLSTACNWKSQCRVSQTRTLIGPGDRSSTWTKVLLRPSLLDTASFQVVLVKQALRDLAELLATGMRRPVTRSVQGVWG